MKRLFALIFLMSLATGDPSAQPIAGIVLSPHSCWRQILLDYPLFRHTGTDSTVAAVAAPKAEYNDTP